MTWHNKSKWIELTLFFNLSICKSFQSFYIYKKLNKMHENLNLHQKRTKIDQWMSLRNFWERKRGEYNSSYCLLVNIFSKGNILVSLFLYLENLVSISPYCVTWNWQNIIFHLHKNIMQLILVIDYALENKKYKPPINLDIFFTDFSILCQYRDPIWTIKSQSL